LRYGYAATSAQLGFGAPVYVADTDEQAMNEARPHIEFLFNKSFKMPSGMFFPPGYTSPASMRQIVTAKSSIMAAQKTIELLAEQRVIIVGTPDTVIKQLKDCHRQLGFSQYVAMLQFGSMPHDMAEKNIRRFAKEVLPALQSFDDRNYQGFEMPKAAAVH
jgi:alkanesulfonate monooxygenase SsuD/methylene tetrahydromethanopterin reductase-like flavin-dependent oxidoreductase (luciferase family)